MRTCCALLSFVLLAISMNALDEAKTRLSQPGGTFWSELAILGSGKDFNEDDFGVTVAISETRKQWWSGLRAGRAEVL